MSAQKRKRPGRYAIVGLGFTERFAALSRDAQLVIAHLATSRHRRSVPGVVSLGPAGFAESIRWSIDETRAALSEGERAGQILIDQASPLIFLPAALADDPPANPNVLKAWRADLAELPASPLVEQIRQHIANVLDGEMRSIWLTMNGSRNGSPDGIGNGSGNGMPNPIPIPIPIPSTNTKERGKAPLGAARPPSLVGDLFELWNEITTDPIPKCRQVTDQRQKHAAARLRELGFDRMREVFTRINDEPFCRGKNDRGWVATIDWALKPSTPARVLEGAYASAKRSSAPGRTGATAGKYSDLSQERAS